MELLANAIKQEAGIKGIQFEKNADDRMITVENSRDSKRASLELMVEPRSIIGHKANIQISNFYVLEMNDSKSVLKSTVYNGFKNYETLTYKSYKNMFKICMLKTKNTDERNQRPEKMERYIFLDGKTEYNYNVHSPLTDLYIQGNSNQNPSGVFVEICNLILECIWEGKETRIVKAIFKKQKSWKTLATSGLIIKQGCFRKKKKRHHKAAIIKKCSTGEGTDTQMNGSEQRVWK